MKKEIVFKALGGAKVSSKVILTPKTQNPFVATDLEMTKVLVPHRIKDVDLVVNPMATNVVSFFV